MKRILSLFLPVLFFLSAQGQTQRVINMPGFQQLGTPSTQTRINGVLYPQVGYAPALYIDTATANANSYLKNIPFAQMSTSSDGKNWYRNADATKWELLGVGSTLSNIGSGYRLAVPGTNNVKTLFATNGLTLDSSSNTNALTFKLGSPLTEPTIITGSETNLLKLDGYTSANVGYLGIGTDFGYIRFGDGGAFSPTYENEIYGGVSQIGLKTTGDIYLDAGDIYTIGIPTVSSTTGRKVALIDTATGKVERIDPAALGGSQNLQQTITNGSTLTTNNTIASGANSLTFSNDRGTVIFDNSSQPLVKINGTGSASLLAVDSGGWNRLRVYASGQVALGDSLNLNVFVGHNSGLNIIPGNPADPPGNWNTSLGTNTLSALTIGNDNVAIGCNAVRYLVTGSHNIGIGTAALNGLTSGSDNVSIGIDAMASTNGDRNTAVGSYSQFTTQGSYNTSLGYGTLYGVYPPVSNTGNYNTVIGYRSGQGITSASENTAVGGQSLYTVSTGGGYLGGNTALGHNAGYSTNGYGNLFLGHSAGVWSNENHAFYLHNWSTSTENEGKERSMFYGNFSPSGANRLRMNGKFGVHSLNSDPSWLPDSAFHVVGNSWLNGKLRITDGTQSNGYVLTSDANGNASWQASTSGFTNPMTTEGDLILATTGGTATRLGIGANGYVLTSNGTTASWQAASAGSPAGNYGNIQLNRNGSFATPGSDSLGYTTSGGLFVHNNMSVGNASNNVATLNIAAKDGEGKLAFKYSTTDYGYFKVNTGSGQVSLGSDQYPVTINSGGTVTINNDFALNTTTLGLGRKMSLRYTGVEYGYFAIETNNSEFRAVSPNAYDFTWRTASTELMRLKESNGSLGIGASPHASAKLTVTSTTQGFLPPRMTGTQAEAISSPAEGLMIYSTDGSGTTITSKGWWGYDGTSWVKLN